MLNKILGHILICPALILVLTCALLNLHGASVKDALGVATIIVVCVASFCLGYDLLTKDK